jgi:hypothetical protein
VARNKIQHRVRQWKDWDAEEFATKNPGKFRKNNYACNCIMCKPWKRLHVTKDERDVANVKKVGQIGVLND